MRRPLILGWFVLAGFCCLFDAARTASAAPADNYWPAARWRSSAPEAQGIDSSILADAFDFVRAHATRIHSLTIVRNGYIVLDARFFPFQEHQLHDVASVTKSITTTLVGVAIGEGRLQGVDQPVLSVFGNRRIAHRDERKERLTVEHLLMMSSGLECRYTGGEPTLREMRRTAEWVQFMLDRPMVGVPGTVPEYCSGGMHLLSGIVSRTTGTSALEYARRRLFGPLGIRRAAWPADVQGVTHGWGDLHLDPMDMARIGYLWLHGGRWKDRQIVPDSWMRAARQPQRPVLTGQYGYGFWVHPDRDPPMFEAVGRGGQRITVIPSKNMVVAITGGAFEPGDVGAFIVKAIRSDSALPANAAALGRLQAAVIAAARTPAAHTASALPSMARATSGKRYVFDDNPIGWRALTLQFTSPDTAAARMEFTDGRVEVRPIGLDGVPRLSPKGRFGLPVALHGAWNDDATFTFEYDEVANVNAFVCRVSFQAASMSLHVTERSGEVDVTIGGKAGTAR